MEDALLFSDLPGFRFHPTEEELLSFFLRNAIFRDKLSFDLVGFLDIYRHDPWQLPGLAKIGEREWYFLVAREKKPSNGGRSSRTSPTGYWKATGSERKVWSVSDPKRVIGFKKTLVFYKGRAPKGTKTDWIMNEYRLPDTCSKTPPKDVVLSKVYRKATSLKVLEQWAEETSSIRSTTQSTPQFEGSYYYATSPLSSTGTTITSTIVSNCDSHEDVVKPMINCHVDYAPPCDEMIMGPCHFAENSSSLRLPLGQECLPKAVDWAQIPLWAQLHSPMGA
ncbi:hypothetical protein V2J09_015546 [Rumex salicifolius]